MSVTETSEEFIVCRDKVDLINSLKGKIERLFGTRINFKEISRDGDKQKRWIEVTGGKWDRQNAKTYIVGLCDPQEMKTIRCTSDILNDIIEDIERNTQAVIRRTSLEDVTISGSELSVTLALSTLEELTKSACETLGNDQKLHDRNRTASHRLDESLKQAFGEDSGSMQNYPDSIKRVLLEYGDMDIREDVEDLLYGSGSQTPGERSQKTSSEIIVRAKEESDSRRNVTVPICHVNAPEHRVLRQEQVVTDSAHNEKPLDDVFTDQFNEAAQISPRSKQLGLNGHGSGALALKRFAKKVGYTNDEIEEGLLYVKPPMMPKDFLEVLKQVKEGKERLGLGNNVGDNQSENARDDEVVVIDSEGESELIIVDDHFSNKPSDGGLTKEDKTLNEVRQEELAKEFDRQNGRRGQRKKKSPTNLTGTKRKSDPDSDSDQTSVLKVWEPIQPLMERVTPNVYRQQKLVSPLPPPPCNPRPLMNVSVPKPTVAIHREVPRPTLIQPFDNYVRETPEDMPVHPDDLRYVIIDGSNVAMCHGNNKVFSCRGIQIAVDYFVKRGHKVTVFVPEWRKYRNYANNRIRDQEILEKLENDERLVFTPSRKVQGRLVASYDDRYILGLAEKEDSVILSNDQYRDLMREKASWKTIIEQRLLMFRFVADHFMPAEDPLGRNGPMLDEFLRKSQPQVPPPRPPRFQDTVPRMIPPQGHPPPGQRPWNGPWLPGGGNQEEGQVQLLNRQQQVPAKRHDDVTRQLYAQLRLVFPESEQDEKVKRILDRYPGETDLNRLTNFCMEIMF